MKYRLFAIGLVVLGVVIGVTYAFRVSDRTPAQNPDPNHTHADFAVWVNGQKLDFSAAEYMTNEDEKDDNHEEHGHVHHPYLHLHDGNGHVVHRHKPGLTIGEFLTSLGMNVNAGCLTLDDLQFQKLEAGWKNDFAVREKLCPNGKFHWTMYVNGIERPVDFDYVFADDDKILFTYDAADDHTVMLKDMTDDACLYSKTCPWRGEPPSENCIADPAVPCTQ